MNFELKINISAILNNFSLKYCLFTTVLAIILASCNDNIRSSIPDYPIYLHLDLTAQYSTFKNSTGQFISTEKGIILTANDRIGFGGVVVCTAITLDDYGNTQYYAFDMACPYEVKNTIKVYPDITGLPYLVCEKCGSVFDVGFGNGNPLSGPSKEFLKRYKTSLSGDYLDVTR